MPGRLTAEVVDAARGLPAANMLVDLFRLPHGAGERHHLRTVETNAGGGTDGPLLEGDEFIAATYELLFHVGRYFKAQHVTADGAPFLDVIPVRFSVADAGREHEVSLLASPWFYTAYSRARAAQ
jgi:5-hydroxyisourate hydrolase